MYQLWQLVVNALDGVRVDDVLVSTVNMSFEEGLLVCHFLELASKVWTYLQRVLPVVTIHYAQMVRLRYCVDFVSKSLRGGRYPTLLEVATVNRFWGPSHLGFPGVPLSRDHDRHL